MEPSGDRIPLPSFFPKEDEEEEKVTNNDKTHLQQEEPHNAASHSGPSPSTTFHNDHRGQRYPQYEESAMNEQPFLQPTYPHTSRPRKTGSSEKAVANQPPASLQRGLQRSPADIKAKERARKQRKSHLSIVPGAHQVKEGKSVLETTKIAAPKYIEDSVLAIPEDDDLKKQAKLERHHPAISLAMASERRHQDAPGEVAHETSVVASEHTTYDDIVPTTSSSRSNKKKPRQVAHRSAELVYVGEESEELVPHLIAHQSNLAADSSRRHAEAGLSPSTGFAIKTSLSHNDHHPGAHRSSTGTRRASKTGKAGLRRSTITDTEDALAAGNEAQHARDTGPRRHTAPETKAGLRRISVQEAARMSGVDQDHLGMGQHPNHFDTEMGLGRTDLDQWQSQVEDSLLQDDVPYASSSNDDDSEPGSMFAEEHALPDHESASENDTPSGGNPTNADEDLVEARPVEGDTVLDLEEASPVNPMEEEHKKLRQKVARLRMLVCLILVGIVVIAIAFGVAFGTQSSSPNVVTLEPASQPTMPPFVPITLSPTPAPTHILDAFRLRLPNSTILRLEDINSAQSQAMAWLEAHPNLESLPEWKLQQLFALATFYYNFGGPTWPDRLSEWLDYERDECNWFSSDFGDFGGYLGLSDPNYREVSQGKPPCDDDGIFISLFLEDTLLLDNDLRVAVPPEISLLSELYRLSLKGNAINASFADLIPEELTRLENFSIVDLNFNEKIRGTIPLYFGYLSALQSFEIWTNKLSGSIPTEVGKMSRLLALNMAENSIVGPLPSEMGSMRSMISLRLFENRFSGAIPSELGLLTNLWQLELQRNNFSSLPTEIFLLTNLAILAIDYELLPTLPSELDRLTKLTDLRLIGAPQNTSTFPFEIFNNSKAYSTELDLSGQGLTGPLPTMLGTLTDLKILQLSSNYFTSALPSELALCTDLAVLDVSNNSLTGCIPTEFGNLFAQSALLLGSSAGGITTQLNVSFNSLSCEIPSELGRPIGMKFLELSSNQLSGTLPSELGLLTTVESLDYSSNLLTGSIPNEFSNLPAQILYLERNLLSGSIMTNFGTMPTLALDLNNNLLQGKIPSELGSMSHLIFFDVSKNGLSGTLSKEIGELEGGPPGFKRLSTYFQENILQGSIPSGFAQLAADRILIGFNISHNVMSGTVPLELCYLADEECKWVGTFSTEECTLDFDCGKLLCGCDCACPT